MTIAHAYEQDQLLTTEELDAASPRKRRKLEDTSYIHTRPRSSPVTPSPPHANGEDTAATNPASSALDMNSALPKNWTGTSNRISPSSHAHSEAATPVPSSALDQARAESISTASGHSANPLSHVRAILSVSINI